MAIHYPPRYRYAWFNQWDKDTFAYIKTLAHTKTHPKILGTKEEKNQYLVMMIRTQKSLHGWEEFLKDTLDHIKQIGAIDTKILIEKYPSESVSKDVPAWVTYEEDKIVSSFINELAMKKIDFVGSDEEIGEFILRFILGQLGHDWESTILMIWEMLGDGSTLHIKDLNNEMKNFDYLKIFEQ